MNEQTDQLAELMSLDQLADRVHLVGDRLIDRYHEGSELECRYARKHYMVGVLALLEVQRDPNSILTIPARVISQAALEGLAPSNDAEHVLGRAVRDTRLYMVRDIFAAIAYSGSAPQSFRELFARLDNEHSKASTAWFAR